MDFFDWNMLNTYAGAAMAVAYIVELTKGLPLIRRIPTQLWSYLVALATLLLAQFFIHGFTMEEASLAVFNAVLVSLASNGGYDVMQRVTGGVGTAVLYDDNIETDEDGLE